jgi:hypothetical protein
MRPKALGSSALSTTQDLDELAVKVANGVIAGACSAVRGDARLAEDYALAA